MKLSTPSPSNSSGCNSNSSSSYSYPTNTTPVNSDATGNLISNLNESLFNNSPIDYFPLKIIIRADKYKHFVLNLIKQFKIDVFCNVKETNVEVNCNDREIDDALINELAIKNIKFELDYSNFISHPGNLFVKNLTTDLVCYDKSFRYFNEHSRFKSLTDINIIKSKGDESFAILKFGNYLDCDYLINHLNTTSNPFNSNPNIPLYLNKYISKKERSLKNAYDIDQGPNTNINASLGFNHSPNNSNDNNIYDSIVIENLDEFFNSGNISIDNFKKFLSKFIIFNDIDLIYFPVKYVSKDNTIKFENFGYVNFKFNENLNNNVLKCLYYLDNLTFDELMNFSDDLKDLNNDLNLQDDEDEQLKANAIKISINQHKFNHYLYKFKTNQLIISLVPTLTISYLTLNYYNLILPRFLKYLNFQETNIYVNNLSILFKNNDSLWELFWLQFGKIKSAKIIKPEFYSKGSNNNFGKIGFIFYGSFKMAIRAILLTNNKIINYNNQSLLIQSSFAIQKSSNSKISPGKRIVNMNNNYYYPPPPPPHPIPSIPAPIYSFPLPIDYYRYYNPYYYSLNYNYLENEGNNENSNENSNENNIHNEI